MSEVPQEFWDMYADRIEAAALENLRHRAGAADTVYLTVESLERDHSVPEGAARELLDNLVTRGYATAEEHRPCPSCRQDLTSEDIERLRCGCGATLSEGSVPLVARTYIVKGGWASRDVRWAISIHGMNTPGAWQQDFSWRLAQLYGYSIPVAIYKYGNVKFAPVVGLLRRRHLKRLVHYLHEVRSEIGVKYGAKPDVIAHSFGTWLLAQALLSDRSDDPIRLGCVILTGSIIRPDFDWEKLIREGRVEEVLCHQAGKDIPVRLTHWFIRGTGPSGVQGFNQWDSVRHIFSPDFGHSDCFTEANLPSVLAKDWAPFLTRSQKTSPSASPNDRPLWAPSRWRVFSLAALYGALLAFAITVILVAASVVIGTPIVWHCLRMALLRQH